MIVVRGHSDSRLLTHALQLSQSESNRVCLINVLLASLARSSTSIRSSDREDILANTQCQASVRVNWLRACSALLFYVSIKVTIPIKHTSLTMSPLLFAICQVFRF